MMTMKLTRQQRMDYAKTLYLRGDATQKEIAAGVGASEQTISKWVRDGRWEQLRASLTLTRQECLSRIYMQIAEINGAIERREPGSRYPTAKEADAINKLAAAIDKMEREVGLKDVIDVSKRFCEWLRRSDVKRAQEIARLFDAFIKELLR
jgi:transcriptional regulator with XRE-family HTH domain